MAATLPNPTTLNVLGNVRNEILNKAKDKLALDLGISAANIKGDLLGKLEESLDRQLKAKIEGKQVNAAIAASFHKPETIKPALKNLVDVTAQTIGLQEFDSALKNNATVLFKTYKAFADAGFSAEQAFQIVLSQLHR